MSILTQLRKDKMQALKEKDTIKNNVCTLLISAIALAQKESPTELSEQDELGYIQKEIKQQKETLKLTPSDRTDIIDETNKKIAILESYLPKQLSHDEIVAAINAIITEKELPLEKRSQGIIMKEMMAKYKGLTDGKSINAALMEILK